MAPVNPLYTNNYNSLSEDTVFFSRQRQRGSTGWGVNVSRYVPTRIFLY